MKRKKSVKKFTVLFLLLLAFLLFRPNFLQLGEREQIFVYRLPGGAVPGGSAAADLAEQLRERHGENVECRFRYLGRGLDGTQYISCIVDLGTQLIYYIAVDDGDLMSEKRAEVLWETMYEKS